MSHHQVSNYITIDYASKVIGLVLCGLVCWLANDKVESICHRLDRIELALFIPAIHSNAQALK